MASINWGVGWVHPTDGLDTNNGFGQDSPKRTIASAYTAGFRVLNVGPGTHGVSSLGDEMTLVFWPGIHNFTNAPVTTDYALSIKGLYPPPDRFSFTGASYITAPSAVSSYFRVGSTTGAVYPRGSYCGDLMFDMSRPTVAGMLYISVCYATVENNVFLAPAGTYKAVYGVKNHGPTTKTEVDNSWDRWGPGNTAVGCPFFWGDLDTQWQNRNTVIGNRGVGNGVNGSLPYVKVEGRSPGWVITDNHFADLSSSAPAAIYCGPTRQNGHYIAGNSFQNINTPNNVAIQLSGMASATIVHSRGATATDGELQMLDIFGTADKIYNGVYNTTDGADNRIIVMDRFNNL